MALPASDNFNRTDALSLGSNWTSIYAPNGGGGQIVSNAAGAYEIPDVGIIWNADTFDDDHYAEGTVSGSPGAGGATGLCVRGSSSGYYAYYSFSGGSYLIRVDADDTVTQLGSTGDAWSDGDTVRLEADGTTITPMINGSEDTSIGAQTDSTYSSGSAGIGGISAIIARSRRACRRASACATTTTPDPSPGTTPRRRCSCR